MSGYSVERSEQIYAGRVLALRRDEVRMPDGHLAIREVVVHPGAVAVVALDEADRVVLVRQYRHPVGGYLVELPAGLLDVHGEAAHLAIQRELHEEAGITAASWHTLVDLRTSPGFSDEAVRVYLARELSDVATADLFVGQHEESDMTVERVHLDDAVRQVLTGAIENAITVAGIMATLATRDAGYADLRPADAGWAARSAVQP
ncbi:NUDIX domain-containing protein [soil metagenome]